MPIWRALARGTPKVSPGTIDNIVGNTRIYHLDLRYDEGVQTLTFYGEIRSSKHPTGYSMQIMFKGVTKTQGLTDEEIAQGYQPKPSLSKNEILVRCSCPSYRFRFDKANRSEGAGAGARFPNYHRLTNRKPNNPRNIIGGCKHTFMFIDYLQRQGFIY